MGDNRAKGLDYEKKAEKKLNGWGLFGSKYEDAADLFDKAGNCYKLAKACECLCVWIPRPRFFRFNLFSLRSVFCWGVGTVVCRGWGGYRVHQVGVVSLEGMDFETLDAGLRKNKW